MHMTWKLGYIRLIQLPLLSRERRNGKEYEHLLSCWGLYRDWVQSGTAIGIHSGLGLKGFGDQFRGWGSNKIPNPRL